MLHPIYLEGEKILLKQDKNEKSKESTNLLSPAHSDCLVCYIDAIWSLQWKIRLLQQHIQSVADTFALSPNLY